LSSHITHAIDELRAQRDELDQLIVSLERIAGGGAPPPAVKRASPRKKKPAKKKARRTHGNGAATIGRTTPGSHPAIKAFRAKILRPILRHEAGTPERAAAFKAAAGAVVTWPNGEERELKLSALYSWVKQAEA